MKVLLLALLALSPAARAADGPATAAYRGVEAVADGFYGLMRGHLISAVLPGGLSRRMSAVPVGTSDKVFAERLRYRQEKASRRMLEERPVGPMGPAESSAWSRRAAGAHATILGDAMADTLVRRYQLERFGRDSGAYASNLDVRRRARRRLPLYSGPAHRLQRRPAARRLRHAARLGAARSDPKRRRARPGRLEFVAPRLAGLV
jgi:hypothetical protein